MEEKKTENKTKVEPNSINTTEQLREFVLNEIDKRASKNKMPTREQIEAWKQQYPMGVYSVLIDDGTEDGFMAIFRGMDRDEWRAMMHNVSKDIEDLVFQDHVCSIIMLYPRYAPGMTMSAAGTNSVVFNEFMRLMHFTAVPISVKL